MAAGILIGLQKEQLIFSRPKYHKREATLISSRNATRKDFEQVIAWLKNKQIMPGSYINNVVKFSAVKDRFPYWLDTAAGIIITLVGKD
jgi:threonine dehydrogenase-like Zn-dependent dehydrogenase